MSSLTELLKKLPIDKVYDDLLHPPLKNVGSGVGNLLEMTFSPLNCWLRRNV